jgi:hypothetical protein
MISFLDKKISVLGLAVTLLNLLSSNTKKNKLSVITLHCISFLFFFFFFFFFSAQATFRSKFSIIICQNLRKFRQVIVKTTYEIRQTE